MGQRYEGKTRALRITQVVRARTDYALLMVRTGVYVGEEGSRQG